MNSVSKISRDSSSLWRVCSYHSAYFLSRLMVLMSLKLFLASIGNISSALIGCMGLPARSVSSCVVVVV